MNKSFFIRHILAFLALFVFTASCHAFEHSTTAVDDVNLRLEFKLEAVATATNYKVSLDQDGNIKFLGYTNGLTGSLNFSENAPYFKLVVMAVNTVNNKEQELTSSKYEISWIRRPIVPPTNIKVSTENSGSEAKTTVTFDPVVRAAYYNLYAPDESGNFAKVASSNTNKIEVTHGIYGPQIKFKLASHNGHTESSHTDVNYISRKASPDPTATPSYAEIPKTPQNLKVDEDKLHDGKRNIALSWAKADYALGYRFYTVSGGRVDKLSDVQSTGLKFTIPKETGHFEVYVTSYNNTGESAQSNKVIFASTWPTPTRKPKAPYVSPTPDLHFAMPNTAPIIKEFIVVVTPEQSKTNYIKQANYKNPEQKPPSKSNKNSKLLSLSDLIAKVQGYLKKLQTYLGPKK